MPESGCVWTAYGFSECEIIGGWDCDKVIGDLMQHKKETVDASLISVMRASQNRTSVRSGRTPID